MKILQWIFSILSLILAIRNGVELNTIPFLLLAMLICPVKSLEKLKKEFGKGEIVIAGIALFVVGCITLPKSAVDEQSKNNTTTVTIESSASITPVVTGYDESGIDEQTALEFLTVLTSKPTNEVTQELTKEPTPELSKDPTSEITNEEISEFVNEPTPQITGKPTITVNPTSIPTPTYTLAPTSKPSSIMTVQFIDVGQADATLISCDGHHMLIDGGNKADSDKMYAILKEKGITKLDIVIGTHAHEDHIGGIPGALNYARADLILCPVTDYDSDAFEDFKKYAGKITVPCIGDEYSLGSAEIEILGLNAGNNTNDTSIVCMLTHGVNKFLFTGDAEYDAEQKILNGGKEISCDVLKVGHHGSDTSTGYLWLRTIMPEYAVISVGKGNLYGHPTDNVLSRLEDAEIKTYRTDLHGDVTVKSDGEKLTITTQNSVIDSLIFVAGDSSTPTNTPKPTITVSSESTGVRYILNINSHKFHYPNCSSVNSMAEHNKEESNENRDTLIARGYSPCGRCAP